jgi:hypothetical protein
LTRRLLRRVATRVSKSSTGESGKRKFVGFALVSHACPSSLVHLFDRRLVLVRSKAASSSKRGRRALISAFQTARLPSALHARARPPVLLGRVPSLTVSSSSAIASGAANRKAQATKVLSRYLDVLRTATRCVTLSLKQSRTLSASAALLQCQGSLCSDSCSKGGTACAARSVFLRCVASRIGSLSPREITGQDRQQETKKWMLARALARRRRSSLAKLAVFAGKR